LLGLDVAREIDAAVAELSSCDRLILDLRGHLGGGLGVLRLMSYLTPGNIPIGFTLSRKRAELGYEKEKLPRLDRLPTHLPNPFGVAVWNHPQCPVHLKKRLLRTVIREIIVTEQEIPPKILMNVHWYGAVHTRLEAPRRTQGQHDNGNTLEVVDLVRELATVCRDSAIVSILNRLGYKTGAENTWTESRVQHLRHTIRSRRARPWKADLG
jgi:hypothetical protein